LHVGEEVEKVPFPPSRITKRDSGTSIATSIGAAIGALVIDFSRQQDCQVHIPNWEESKTIAGMSAVFREMAHGGKDGGYDWVAPWKVLECSGNFMNDWNEAERRQYICGTICRALVKTNRGNGGKPTLGFIPIFMFIVNLTVNLNHENVFPIILHLQLSTSLPHHHPCPRFAPG
jgi:hypothetical protein